MPKHCGQASQFLLLGLRGDCTLPLQTKSGRPKQKTSLLAPPSLQTTVQNSIAQSLRYNSRRSGHVSRSITAPASRHRTVSTACRAHAAARCKPGELAAEVASQQVSTAVQHSVQAGTRRIHRRPAGAPRGRHGGNVKNCGTTGRGDADADDLLRAPRPGAAQCKSGGEARRGLSV